MYQGNIYRLAVFVLLLGWLAVALFVANGNIREASQTDDASPQQTLASQLSDATAHKKPSVPKGTLEGAVASKNSAGLFVATIRRPDGPPRIDSGVMDPQGRSGTVACSTCHSVREPNFANRSPADLDQFHQGMSFAHGSTTCYSCHNSGDADTLRLADSTTVEYVDVMTLCAQCHGSQWRDYQHGAHGGMNGYWDLTRGPQTRNNCIDCHDPHVPAFPKMKPTFKPRDRFLSPPADEHHGAARGATANPMESLGPSGLGDMLAVNPLNSDCSCEPTALAAGDVKSAFNCPRLAPSAHENTWSVRDPAAYASRLTEDCDDPIRLLNQGWAV
ncbi:hypothetical protein SH528x_002609 [Novipirellula sp. SH528]|uniref:hypothetical protein n=1 Tax=Novipirellula sp. SH528 TaxID=3454466 RepID=UPI003FA1862D